MTIRIILAALLILPLLAFTGCDEIGQLTGSSSSDEPQIVEKTEIGNAWTMTRMKLKIQSDDELSILLKLDSGDQVDGFFYTDDEEPISFTISGDSLIYASEGFDSSLETVSSDRFSFIASNSQGSTYTLLFENPENDSGSAVTVNVEVLFPNTGSIFIPVQVE